MTPTVHDFLAADHARLDGLVAVALAADGLDLAAYEQFRAGLLRHIGMEEKILLPAAKRARGGTALPAARLLRHDHSALAALLVPTPMPEGSDEPMTESQLRGEVIPRTFGRNVALGLGGVALAAAAFGWSRARPRLVRVGGMGNACTCTQRIEP